MRTPTWILTFDMGLGDSIHELRTPVLTGFFYLSTLLANTGTVVFITFAAVGVLMLRRRFAEAILVTVVVAGGQTLGTVAKSAIVRARPPAVEALIPLPGSYSFPSGHSLAAMLLYGVLAFLLVRSLSGFAARFAVSLAAVVLIALVGVSRVYLGVHWPSDVVAAWILGGAWLALCAAVYVGWDRRRGADPGAAL